LRPLALLLGFLALVSGAAVAADVTVTVDQIHSADGKIYVTLWGSREAWLDDQKSLQNVGVQAASQVAVTLRDVAPGRYAIATFHDENDSGEMDFNFFGYPEEGYAFSNDVRPFLSAPSFESCAFDVGIDDGAITIHMVYP
jgi:uncharacterized protein (DUF2141 family)